MHQRSKPKPDLAKSNQNHVKDFLREYTNTHCKQYDAMRLMARFKLESDFLKINHVKCQIQLKYNVMNSSTNQSLVALIAVSNSNTRTFSFQMQQIQNSNTTTITKTGCHDCHISHPSRLAVCTHTHTTHRLKPTWLTAVAGFCRIAIIAPFHCLHRHFAHAPAHRTLLGSNTKKSFFT